MDITEFCITAAATGAIGIIAYFLSGILGDIKESEKIAINQNNKVNLIEERLKNLEQRSEDALKHLAENTSQKLDKVSADIKHLSGNVAQFTNNVTRLIEASEHNANSIENLLKISERHEAKIEIYDVNILSFFKDHGHLFSKSK